MHTLQHNSFRHGKGSFSSKGIEIVVDYFKKRGHKGITVFLPRWRKQWEDTILNQLQDEGILTLTPSRKIEGKLYASYDDRCVLVYFLYKTISVFVCFKFYCTTVHRY